MTLSAFEPQNDLEIAIVQAERGTLPLKDVLAKLAEVSLYISSKSEVRQDGSGFDPLLLERDGSPLVAAFSSLERPNLHADMAPFILQMNGREFFLRLPPGYGVIINPGYMPQLIIAPSAILDLKEELAKK